MAMSKRLIDLLKTQCGKCVKKRKLGEKDLYECQVLNNFYFTDETMKSCWAFEDDLIKWYQLLVSLGRNPENMMFIQQVEKQLNDKGMEGWLKAYKEDLKRGKPGGGGEKADKTNKMFGPQRMKDNRWMPKWGEN